MHVHVCVCVLVRTCVCLCACACVHVCESELMCVPCGFSNSWVVCVRVFSEESSAQSMYMCLCMGVCLHACVGGFPCVCRLSMCVCTLPPTLLISFAIRHLHACMCACTASSTSVCVCVSVSVERVCSCQYLRHCECTDHTSQGLRQLRHPQPVVVLTTC